MSCTYAHVSLHHCPPYSHKTVVCPPLSNFLDEGLLTVHVWYRRADYSQGYIISWILKIFVKQKFSWKNFEVIDDQRNYFPDVRSTWRQDVRSISVIRGHHNYTKIFYANAPLERHSKAEENPTMTLLIVSCDQTLIRAEALSLAVYKRPREYRAWLR